MSEYVKTKAHKRIEIFLAEKEQDAITVLAAKLLRKMLDDPYWGEHTPSTGTMIRRLVKLCVKQNLPVLQKKPPSQIIDLLKEEKEL